MPRELCSWVVSDGRASPVLCRCPAAAQVAAQSFLFLPSLPLVIAETDLLRAALMGGWAVHKSVGWAGGSAGRRTTQTNWMPGWIGVETAGEATAGHL